MNLTEKYRYKINKKIFSKNDYSIFVSSEAKYMWINYSKKYKLFDWKTGNFLHSFDSKDYQYTKFINSNEMIWTSFHISTGFSKIGRYNVENKKIESIVSLNKFYSSIIPNSDGKAWLLEHDNVLYYLDLKSGDKEPVKLMEGYEVIRTQSIVKDFCSVFYSEESKYYFALYKKSKLVFRK